MHQASRGGAHRKRSRAQFLVVVDQSVRRGEATKIRISERAGTVPGEKLARTPPLRTDFFTGSRDYCACVLCDRDNLSPLKEFRDISSRVLSVAKTGLVLEKRRSDRREEKSPPSPKNNPTPLHPLGRLAKIGVARKKHTIDQVDRNYHLGTETLTYILLFNNIGALPNFSALIVSRGHVANMLFYMQMRR